MRVLRRYGATTASIWRTTSTASAAVSLSVAFAMWLAARQSGSRDDSAATNARVSCSPRAMSCAESSCTAACAAGPTCSAGSNMKPVPAARQGRLRAAAATGVDDEAEAGERTQVVRRGRRADPDGLPDHGRRRRASTPSRSRISSRTGWASARSARGSRMTRSPVAIERSISKEVLHCKSGSCRRLRRGRGLTSRRVSAP